MRRLREKRVNFLTLWTDLARTSVGKLTALHNDVFMSQVFFIPGSFILACAGHILSLSRTGATKFMKQSVSAEQIELKSSLPGSKKVYVDGPREGMKVPMREIEQSETNGVPNPPIRVYDTSGIQILRIRSSWKKEFQRRATLGLWGVVM